MNANLIEDLNRQLARLITIEKAAIDSGIPTRTLRTWCKQGRLKNVMLAGEYRIDPRDLAKVQRPARGKPPAKKRNANKRSQNVPSSDRVHNGRRSRGTRRREA